MIKVYLSAVILKRAEYAIIVISSFILLSCQSSQTGAGLDDELSFKAKNYCDALVKTVSFALKIHVTRSYSPQALNDALTEGAAFTLEYYEKSSDEIVLNPIVSQMLESDCSKYYEAAGVANEDDEQQYRLIAITLDAALKSLDPHSGYVSKSNLQRYFAGEEGIEQDTFGILFRYNSAMRAFLVLEKIADVKLVEMERLDLNEYRSQLNFAPYLEVDFVLPGSSAAQAGIQSGDQITHVDDTEVTPENHAVILNQIAEAKSLHLTIVTPAGGTNRKVKVEREKAKLALFTAEKSQANFSYLRLSQIMIDGVSEKPAADALQDKLLQLDKDGLLEGLVLDLRGNPGGFVQEAVNVVDLFVGEAPVVCLQARENVSDEMRQRNIKNFCFAAENEMDFNYDGPLVILVDQATASAAELIAQSLADLGRAVVIGEITFGKGTAFRRIPLAESTKIGGLILVTTAIYRTPSGRSPQFEGLTPHWLIIDPWQSKFQKEAHAVRSDLIFREPDYGNAVIGAQESKNLLNEKNIDRNSSLRSTITPIIEAIEDELAECDLSTSVDCVREWGEKLVTQLGDSLTS